MKTFPIDHAVLISAYQCRPFEKIPRNHLLYTQTICGTSSKNMSTSGKVKSNSWVNSTYDKKNKTAKGKINLIGRDNTIYSS